MAYLLLLEAHREDHRSAGDNLFRVRRKGYWIVRGKKLAEKIAHDCVTCKKIVAKTEEQRMADLPRVVFDVPCRPFSHICIDYTGAVSVRDVVKKRVTMKAFPLVFCCINTGAIHLQLSTSYSTTDFITQFAQFCALRGKPSYVRTDMGSQLRAAFRTEKVKAKQRDSIQDGDPPLFDWLEIQKSQFCADVEFSYAPCQAQWRNGRAESAVRALKKTLRHLHAGNDSLNYAEFSCLLSRAAALINLRPVGTRHHSSSGSGEICVITPSMLVNGGRLCTGPDHERDFCKDMSSMARMSLVEQNFVQWWKRWFEQAWESFLPVKKWRTLNRNLRVGDIVLLKYSQKLAKPGYRYGRVVEVSPDQHGVVRTVEVATRSRRFKESPREYSPVPLDRQRVPVQRLVLLLPAEDQAGLPPASEEVHICDEELRVPADLGPQNLSEAPHDPAVPPAHGPAVELEAAEVEINCIRALLESQVLSEDDHHLCWQCDIRERIINKAETS